MEKDFEQREGKSYQEQIRREGELQKEIDELAVLMKPTCNTIVQLQLRNAFDRLQVIRLTKKVAAEQKLSDSTIEAVSGFLRGTSLPIRLEVEKQYQERLKELESNTNDLCEQVRKLDYKNTMLEDQIKVLDSRIVDDVGIKLTQAERVSLVALEEMRKFQATNKSLLQENKTLESIINSHAREIQSLMTELKKFNKGKVRSNIVEAELHRKM